MNIWNSFICYTIYQINESKISLIALVNKLQWLDLNNYWKR